jgi:hypothetical protein
MRAVALSPGTRLGPYEIAALVGAGGMGEVYRATDTGLKRTVAIKVLPESLASDGDRLARVGIGPATYAQIWASNSGALVYRRPEAPSGGTPAFVDRTGRERGIVPGVNAPALYPRLSPDGTRLAIFIAGDLWVYDLAGRPPVRLTTGGVGYSPLRTPDGKSVVYEPSGSLGLGPMGH